jgi:hypothetical protein
MQEFALVNLVPRRLTGTSTIFWTMILILGAPCIVIFVVMLGQKPTCLISSANNVKTQTMSTISSAVTVGLNVTRRMTLYSKRKAM